MAQREDDVKKLFAALPALGSNSVGVYARNGIVNRIKQATPGRITMPYWIKGATFRKTFFPHYAAMTYQDRINGCTGLDDSFWSEYAISSLCDAMYHFTSDLRKQLVIDRIRGDLNQRAETLNRTKRGWYLELLRVYGDSAQNPVKTALSAITDKAAARGMYRSFLTHNAWIAAKAAQYAQGDWPNADWELYHHWLKLRLLDDGEASIDALIGQLVGKGLPVPDAVRQQNWQSYAVWFGGAITWNDFSEASDGILRVVCYTYPGSYIPPCCMSESNSYEFTADSQPGSKYRQAPSSCCFRRGAMVRMADGALRAIETIQPGEQVLTPKGSRAVLLVSMPIRGKRPLHAINHRGFQFSATHPFVLHGSEHADRPHYACVDPVLLMNDTPTLSVRGILHLWEDHTGAVLCRHSSGGHEPEPVQSLQTYEPGDEKELLYDLILDFERDGASEYYVGDKEAQYLVSSEMPLPAQVGALSTAFMRLYRACSEEILDVLKDEEIESYTDLLYQCLGVMRTSLFPLRGALLTDTTPAGRHGADEEEAAFFPMLQSALRAFSPTTDAAVCAEYSANTRLGTLFNALWSVIGIPLIDELGLPGSLQSEQQDGVGGVRVTVYHIELAEKEFAGGDEVLELAIELNDGTVKQQAQMTATPRKGYRHGLYYDVKQSAVFDKITAVNGVFSAPCSITFRLGPQQKRTDKKVQAFLYLPPTLAKGTVQIGYLRNEVKENIGCITFDSRVADAREESLSVQCDGEYRSDDAISMIGDQLGAYIRENFRAAVRVFHHGLYSGNR